LRLAGWRFAGEIPNRPKLVFIVAPHTSNWDFVVGIAAVFALGLRVTFLGKHTLFRQPLGIVMRWLGGIPVVRHSRQNVVEQTVHLIGEMPRVALGLSPEGTRRKLPRWRSGFHYVARGAGIPIAPVAFDYSTRTIRFFPLHRPSESVDEDLRVLGLLFDSRMARIPAQY
jgi:1-acyl-sn-glycerol-3-phosphate acyltransferase